MPKLILLELGISKYLMTETCNHAPYCEVLEICFYKCGIEEATSTIKTLIVLVLSACSSGVPSACSSGVPSACSNHVQNRFLALPNKELKLGVSGRQIF